MASVAEIGEDCGKRAEESRRVLLWHAYDDMAGCLRPVYVTPAHMETLREMGMDTSGYEVTRLLPEE